MNKLMLFIALLFFAFHALSLPADNLIDETTSELESDIESALEDRGIYNEPRVEVSGISILEHQTAMSFIDAQNYNGFEGYIVDKQPNDTQVMNYVPLLYKDNIQSLAVLCLTNWSVVFSFFHEEIQAPSRPTSDLKSLVELGPLSSQHLRYL